MVGDGAPALVARALAAGGGGSHGMAAALPFVDDFVEGHSLEAIEELARVISR